MKSRRGKAFNAAVAAEDKPPLDATAAGPAAAPAKLPPVMAAVVELFAARAPPPRLTGVDSAPPDKAAEGRPEEVNKLGAKAGLE